jgi:very-short-patch-repair endonuclease
MCRNKTEAKLNAFLNGIFGTVIYQLKVDWCKNFQTNRYFPFDFCLILYKIIIELDGRQHFQDMEYWYSSADDVQDRDKYKMRMAKENGYSVIRISQEDVWKDKYDWQNDLLGAIEACKNEIRVMFCSKNKDLYVNHK